MRILVTGGCGFIGTSFIRTVLGRYGGVRITNLDALTYAGNPANLADYAQDQRYEFVRGSINDAELLRRVVPGHDAVVNFAAESHVDRSIADSRPFLETNVLGAATLFDAAMRAEVPRCLQVSTDETYGSIPHPGRSREDDKLEPNSPYSASKAAGDLVARSYHKTHGYPISVTRTTNNFGAYHYPEKIIPLFITNLIDGEPVPLYGDGQNVRDWTYVEDNVAALWLVLTQGAPGEVYNVGAGNEMTNRHLAERILEHFGCDESMIRHVADRPGHDRRYAVDTTKVRALGWRPRTRFDDALERTIRWYRANQSWWRPLKDQGATKRWGVSAA